MSSPATIDKTPWRISKIGNRFAERTSMQGIAYITSSKTLYGKAAWIFLLLVTSGAMVFHLYYLTKTYMQFEKTTSIKLGFDALRFPAVSFCNVNPIRQSEMYRTNYKLQVLVEQVNPSYVKVLYDNDVDSTTTERPDPEQVRKKRSISENMESGEKKVGLSRKKRVLDKVTLNESYAWGDIYDVDDDYYDEDDWENVAPRDPTDVVYDNFIAQFNAEDRSTRIAIGHDLETMLIKCTFAGRTCYAQNFTQFTNEKYGNCYTLKSPLYKSRRSGQSQGMELILFMENDEYIRGITNGFGATLIISDSDAIPNIDNGIAVSSALETQVGLRLIHISRIGKPYGECTELSEFKKKYNVTYERTTCQKFCEAKSVMDTCNCSSFFSEEVNLKLGKQRTIPGVCRTATELECLIGARKKFERGQTECQCGDPCTETIYEKFISSRAWPSDDYAKLLLDLLCEKTGTSACTTLYNQYTASQLAQNFIKLNIYYEDLNYQNITEKEDYEDVQFISDIGGTIGLWIGLSILSIFEVLQFFGELIRYGGRCGRTQNN